MSDTLYIRGLKAERGQKLQTIFLSWTLIRKYLSLSLTVKMTALLF